MRRPIRPRPGWVILLLAHFTTLLVVDPARAQYFGQNKVQYHARDWSVAKTKHFLVHFHEGERETALDVCRMAERAYGRLSAILKHDIEEPVPVILYASQAEFQQTNVTDGLIGEGTGGFTEFLKGRVTLPLTGSYRDLDHVLTHELVHAFQVDILFGGKHGMGNPFQYAPPLWFMEGMAEYLSLVEVDPLTEMWLRDGALEGYLTSIDLLERVGDIRVYRYGQSILSYLGRTFGDEAIGEVLKKVAHTRSLPQAFEQTLGITMEKFSENWTEDVRKTYLPTIRDHQKPEDFAYRLTHADRDLADINLGPALSPEGDRMVYFSNPAMYNDLFLASAIDGKVERRLVKGERQADFESLRYYTSSLDWSPDGELITFAALYQGRDAIYVQRVRDGQILSRIRPPVDGILNPTWSPDGEWIAYSGMEGGRSHLYRTRRDGSPTERLTDGRFMVAMPRYSPDGSKIAFVTDRGPGADDQNLLFPRPGVALYDVSSGEIAVLENQHGRNVDPQFFPDGRHLLFISDRSGIANLWIRDLETGEDRRVTDILTGVTGIIPNGTAVSLSRSGKRLVFSAFSEGTWDLYAIKDPLALWDRGEAWTPTAGDTSAVADLDTLATPPAAGTISDGTREAAIANEGHADRSDLDSLWASIETLDEVREDSLTAPRFDSMDDSPKAGEEEPTPIQAAKVFEEQRELPGATDIAVEPYRPRFSADYVTANGFFASNVGLAAQSVLRFSDLLGDQVILVGADVYGSLKDSNLLFEYLNLKHRTNWGASAFQFRNDYYIFTPDTQNEYVSRIYRGIDLTLQRPWSRFSRVEFSVEGLGVTEEVLKEHADGYLYLSEDNGTYYYAKPGVALVRDNTLYGYTGPISGGRDRVSADLGVGDLSFRSYVGDLRRYWNIRHRYAFAYRAVGAVSEGHDPQMFQIGGPYTLRGYDFGEFRGSRVLLQNVEFRFPLIEQLRLGWPLPLSLAGVRGALFLDAGAAYDQGERFQPFTRRAGLLRTEDVRASYGISASTNLGFTVLKWDLSWRTDLARTFGKPRGFLSFGLDY